MLVELDVGHERGVRLGEQVGPAGGADRAALEHARGEAHRRGVDPHFGVHVADIGGLELEVVDPQGLEGPVVLVGDVAPRDLEPVDLEGIDRLQRVLPPLVLHRGGVVDLLLGLGEIEDDHRPLDEDVADHPAGQEGPPVHARVEPADVRHRRVGMLMLDDHGVPQVEREVDRVEMERADGRGVALQPRVHLRFRVAAQRLVDEEERGDGGDAGHDDEGDGREDPATPGHGDHEDERKQGACPASRRILRPGGREVPSGTTGKFRPTGAIVPSLPSLSPGPSRGSRWHRS